MSLGKGAVPSFSTNQNKKGKIYIEVKMIGVDDDVAKILWSRYFIEALG